MSWPFQFDEWRVERLTAPVPDPLLDSVVKRVNFRDWNNEGYVIPVSTVTLILERYSTSIERLAYLPDEEASSSRLSMSKSIANLSNLRFLEVRMVFLENVVRDSMMMPSSLTSLDTLSIGWSHENMDSFDLDSFDSNLLKNLHSLKRIYVVTPLLGSALASRLSQIPDRLSPVIVALYGEHGRELDHMDPRYLFTSFVPPALSGWPIESPNEVRAHLLTLETPLTNFSHFSSLSKNLAVLAKSNDSPSDEQVQEIKSCLADLEIARFADLARLDALGQQLKAITIEQANVQESINAKERQAASLLGLLGIRRLPSEMLQEIFSFVALNPQASWQKPRFPALHASSEGPLLVRRICRRWRDVIDRHKRVWSYVHLQARHLSLVLSPRISANIERPLTNWVSLSKSEDIHMSIDFEGFELRRLPGDISNISCFWIILTRICGSRLASLELLNVLDDDQPNVLDDQAISTPRLRRLSYQASHQAGDSFIMAQRWAKLPRTAPMLTTLTLRFPLHRISPNYWNSSPWHILTELECTTGEPLLSILETATSLRRLRLTKAVPAISHTPPPEQRIFVVSSLEELHITQPSHIDHWTALWTNVLEYITLPSLHTLALTLRESKSLESTVMGGIAHLIKKSGCTLEHFSFHWCSAASVVQTILSPSRPIVTTFLDFLDEHARNIRTLELGFGSDPMMTREVVSHLTKVLPPASAGSSIHSICCPNVTHMVLEHIAPSGRLSIPQLALQRLDPSSADVDGDQLRAVESLSLSFDFPMFEKLQSNVSFAQNPMDDQVQKTQPLSLDEKLERLREAYPSRLILRYNHWKLTLK
ncbi:hypothetical protein DL96DRAFT_1814057 [Flagelloscypha sp. PMI_526]|nr:hypothetical protein DL96DRAFT_1814057 [Flagelloscypha sp. PMI_526]